MCCFGNLTAVRERILAWWSSVSTIDANNHPEINTRVLLVCGNDGPSAAAEGEEVEEAESAAEMSGGELLSGVLLYQLMQCADVEITDERPDGPTRHALREVMTATRDDGPGGGWPKARPRQLASALFLFAAPDISALTGGRGLLLSPAAGWFGAAADPAGAGERRH